jgi:solute:Na+ symporter, SSS family
VLILLVISGVYAALSGFVGVVKTDVVQFFLAIGTSIVLAVMAVADQGGVFELRRKLLDKCSDNTRALDAFPEMSLDSGDMWRFWFYVTFVWMGSRDSDGSGYIAQRMLACKDEVHAKKATLWFNFLHFVARPWPWVLVALAAIVELGDENCSGEDPEKWYPAMMVLYLGRYPGLLGLALAGLFAAFMSTVDTHLNWGTSYLIHDVYIRFINPAATEKRIAMASRVCVLVIMLISGIGSLFMVNVSTAWELMSLGQGSVGLVYMARWLWWRVNAWSEISCMITGVLAAAIAVSTLDTDRFYALQVIMVVGSSCLVSFVVSWRTGPEADATLDEFYSRVRPIGWWGPVARRVNSLPKDSASEAAGGGLVELDDTDDDMATPPDPRDTILDDDAEPKSYGTGDLSNEAPVLAAGGRRPVLVLLLKWILGCFSLYSLMFGVGELLMGNALAGVPVLCGGVAASSVVVWLLHKRAL